MHLILANTTLGHTIPAKRLAALLGSIGVLKVSLHFLIGSTWWRFGA